MKFAADIQLLFGLVITYFDTNGWKWMFENFTFFYFMWWQLYMMEAVISISKTFNILSGFQCVIILMMSC